MSKLSENLEAKSPDSLTSSEKMYLDIRKLLKDSGITEVEKEQRIPSGRLVATFHNPTKKKTTEPPTG